MPAKPTIKKIGWKTSGLSPDLASVRYRAILPILSLQAEGVDFQIISSPTNIDFSQIDAIVIVKSFTPEDLFLAQQAHINHVPVFFDLCDNIFIVEYKGKQTVTPAEMFYAIMPFLSGITVTTSSLQEVVDGITQHKIPSFIVPDGIETAKEYKAAKAILTQAAKNDLQQNISTLIHSLNDIKKIKGLTYFKLKKLKSLQLHYHIKNYLKPATWISNLYSVYDFFRSKITNTPRKISKPLPFFTNDIYFSGNTIANHDIPINIKRVIWFGNHGAKYANFGMLDLLPLRNSLEKVNKVVSIELIVVSNNRDKFLKYISRFECITRYVEWSATAVDDLLKTADAVLVPNSKDSFSICKSANRTVLSIKANVPVVATLTPSLEGLKEAIYCDDFFGDLKNCLLNPAEARKKVTIGKKLIKKLFGQQAIANAFLHALKKPYRPSDSDLKSNIVIALNLVQDYELAKPIATALKQNHIPFTIWISFSLTRNSPKTLQWLTEEQIPYLCLPDDFALTSQYNLFTLYDVKCLLTMVETNLGPHKFTFTFTELANNSNVKTFTVQHGYENIGLTYSDNVHNIQKIKMASKHILTWGNQDTLHTEIKDYIKHRIIPVGCIKPVWPSQTTPTPLDQLDGIIIGIFENLHWHRYSADYQQQFIDSINICAAKYPAITFFIKPHPAGMWLTSRFKGSVPQGPNILIANQAESVWEKPVLGDFMRKLSAVISTPSTVILDSARADIPTLVCGFDLQLDKFEPLPIAKTTSDWLAFVQKLETNNTADLHQKNTQFVERAVIQGDAIDSTLKLLLA